MIFSKKKFIFIGVSLLLQTHIVLADKILPTEMVYDIFTEGEEIGEVCLLSRQETWRGQTVTRFESAIKIHFTDLWFQVDIQIHRTELFSVDHLVYFKQQMTENGKVSKSEGEWQNGGLHINTTVKGKTSHQFIPSNRFDGTFTEIPFLLDEKKARRLRLLDMETLQISTVMLYSVGQEKIRAAGQTFDCQVMEIQTQLGKARYWVSKDTNGLFLVKETGVDEDGLYEILLKKYHLHTQ